MSSDQYPDTRDGQAAHHNADAALALLAAAAQVGVAFRESQGPVSELSSLLAHLAQTLAALRSAPLTASADNSVSAPIVRGLLEQVQSEVFSGIQQLQFYDRMVQHLTHVQEHLVSVANELGSLKTNERSGEVWNELNARLRKRLISDEQRGLLDVFLTPDTPTRVGAKIADPDYSPPGSIDMF
jgi:hypothetical protein